MSLNPLEPLVDLFADPPAPGIQFRYATVTGVNPLRVQFDGEASPMPVTPGTIARVLVGDRVLVAHHGGTVATVLGRLGGPNAPNPPTVVAARTLGCNPTSVPNSSWTPVSGGYVSAAGDPGNVPGGIQYGGGVLTVPVAGTYSISVNFTYTSTGSYQRSLGVLVNGSMDRAATIFAPGSMFVSGEYNLQAGGTFQAQTYQASGGSLTPNGGTTYNWMSCSLVERAD